MWADRVEAGRALAEALSKYKGSEAIVVGIPRGGVVIAAQIAEILRLPLQILMAKKIGAPFNPELAIGAVTEDGNVWVDQGLAAATGSDNEYIARQAASLVTMIHEKRELLDPEGRFTRFSGKLFIIADDGIATGATIFAAIEYLKRQGAKVVVAAPVCPPDTADKIRAAAAEAVFLDTPADFSSVGQFYGDFTQTEDSTVIRILENASQGSNNER